MTKRMPEWALVTGAASGIGRCVALDCARRGMKLVLVDINETGLEKIALEICDSLQTEVKTLALNLALEDSPQKCLEFCDEQNIHIDFLANIAGIFIFDPLTEADPKKTSLMLDLHVKTVTRMSILFAQRMKERRFGFIFNMASMSAWMPMPGIVTYNASKSYVQSMSRSLRFELLPWDVSVTVVCPGGVNTPLLPLPDKLRSLAVRLGFLMSPEKLAKKAVNATLKRKNQTIPGIMNHVMTFFIMTMPDWLVSCLMKRVPIYKRFYPDNKTKQSETVSDKKDPDTVEIEEKSEE